MRVRNLICTVGLCVWTVALAAACSPAPAPNPATKEGTAAPAVPAMRADGNLAQVMRGILFPASNVIFAAQSSDPATVKPADDPSTSPNPLTSRYGGWDAVGNAGIALA